MMRYLLISKKQKTNFMNPLNRANALNILNDGINQNSTGRRLETG